MECHRHFIPMDNPLHLPTGMISDILGITISSPGYHHLAQEAAARFRKYTGCECLILTSERAQSYDLKYHLPFFGDRTLCFFDADLWFVRRVDLEPFRQIEGIAAVKDASRHCQTSFCLGDSISLNFDAESYVNTGMMFINTRSEAVKRAFNDAASMLAHRDAGIIETLDTTEQSVLNAAIHKSGAPMMYLGNEWNFWPHAWHRGWMDSIPSKPLNIHAAGILLPEKMQFLKDQCKVWEF